MKSPKIMLIGAASSLVWCWAFSAMAADETATPAMPPPANTPTEATAPPGEAMAEHAKLHLCKSSEAIGTEVINPQGEKLGHIRDLAVDGKRGQVVYAVLEFDRLLDLRDKLFAVPWTALKPETKEGMIMNHKVFILDTPRAKLSSAPGFNKDKWPDMADRTWETETHKFYDQKPYWEIDREQHRKMDSNRPPAGGADIRSEDDTKMGVDSSTGSTGIHTDADRERGSTEADAATGQPHHGKRMILKAKEQLIGANIVDQNGKKLGDVKNLLIDRTNGHIALVVAKISDMDGDKDMAALPWPTTRWQWNEEKKTGNLLLTVAANEFKPHMFPGNNWPDWSDRNTLAQVYRDYNVRPYWEHRPQDRDVLGYEE